jgi:hypothetical protein
VGVVGTDRQLTGQGIKCCLALGQLLLLTIAHVLQVPASVFKRAQPFSEHHHEHRARIAGVDNERVHGGET